MKLKSNSYLIQSLLLKENLLIVRLRKRKCMKFKNKKGTSAKIEDNLKRALIKTILKV
jgi:hypothetical protein